MTSSSQVRKAYGRAGKVKLSGAVEGWTLAVLETFRRDARLGTRSAALCEALAQWARDYRKELDLEKVLARYGEAYRRASGREEQGASRLLPLTRQVRGLP